MRDKKDTKKRVIAKKLDPSPNLQMIAKKKDIDMIEDETLRKVGNTIRSIERFMKKWETSGEKPMLMEHEVMELRRYHRILGRWHDRALKAHKNKNDTQENKIRRVREFIKISLTFS